MSSQEILLVSAFIGFVALAMYFLFKTNWRYRFQFKRYRRQTEYRISWFQDQIKRLIDQVDSPENVENLMATGWQLIYKLIVENRQDLIDQLGRIAQESRRIPELLLLSEDLALAVDMVNETDLDYLAEKCRDYLANRRGSELLFKLSKAFTDVRCYDKALLLYDVYLELSQDAPDLTGTRGIAMSNYLVLLNTLGEYNSQIIWSNRILSRLTDNNSSESLMLRAETLWVLARAYIRLGGEENREKALSVIGEALTASKKMFADEKIPAEWKFDLQSKINSYLISFGESVPIADFKDKLYRITGFEPPVPFHKRPELNPLKKNRRLRKWAQSHLIEEMRGNLFQYVIRGSAYGVSYWFSQIAQIYLMIDPDRKRLISFARAKRALKESLYYAKISGITERIIHTYMKFAQLYTNASSIPSKVTRRHKLIDETIEWMAKAEAQIDETSGKLPALYRWSIDRAHFLESFAHIFRNHYFFMASHCRFWEALLALERLKAKNLVELAGLDEKFYDDKGRQKRLETHLSEVKSQDQELPWVNWFQRLICEAKDVTEVRSEKHNITGIINPEHLSKVLDEHTAIVQFLLIPEVDGGEILVLARHINDYRLPDSNSWTIDQGFMFSRHRFGTQKDSSNFHRDKESTFYITLERITEQWQKTLEKFENRIKKGGQITDMDDEWIAWNNQLSTLIEKLADLLDWESFLTQQASLLEELGFRRLIIIPHHLLTLYPLHALPAPGHQCHLIDSFDISYGPSLGLMLLTNKRERAAWNPEKSVEVDVRSSDIEGTSDAKLLFFIEELVLQKFIEAIRNASVLNFDCHGAFDSKVPLRSSLGCAENPDALNAAKVFLSFYLPDCHLVFLNACNTGERSLSAIDEQMGLDVAFLQSGAKEVISSLWLADDKVAQKLRNRFKSLAYLKINENFCDEIREIKKNCDLLSWAPFVHLAL